MYFLGDDDIAVLEILPYLFPPVSIIVLKQIPVVLSGHQR